MAKARTYPITKIDTAQFTPLMITQLKVSVERYLYLKNEYPAFLKRPYDANDDFVIEYSDYYALNASLKDFSKPIVKQKYFEQFKKERSIDPPDVVNHLKEELRPHNVVIGNHLSFCSKLCHTICDIVPIYDSRVEEYLETIYGITDDYQSIHDWYYTHDDDIKKDQKELLDWFRNHPQFKQYKNVNDIKVLDSIIFIWHKYH